MAEPSTAIDSTVVAFVILTLWSGMGPACPNQDYPLAQGTIKAHGRENSLRMSVICLTARSWPKSVDVETSFCN